MATGKTITTGKVLGYILMPRIFPRAKNLFASGFGHIAFLMAQVYALVRLLPASHPYLQAKNIGKFGIRHVIIEAANRLVLKKQNFDQIVIFFTLMTGIILLTLQIGSLAYSVITQPVFAQESIFTTDHPEKDMALILMDRVFGVPKLTCNPSNVCTEINGDLPYPFHKGLQGMFQFYSLGILLVGVLIFLYHIVVVVAETATSGSPFGQRFANVWVPIRLVVAIGLLVPLNYGLNSAQYITLYAAKFGSGLATNGWIQFNRALSDPSGDGGGGGGNDKRESLFPGTNVNDDGTVGSENFNPTGEKETLVARPNTPDTAPIVQFITLVHTCAQAYWIQDHRPDGEPPTGYKKSKAYFIKNKDSSAPDPSEVKDVSAGTSYEDALKFYNNGDIIIRFGEKDEQKFKDEKGSVHPTCGEIRIQTSSIASQDQNGPGPNKIQEHYFNVVKQLWFNDQDVRKLAKDYAEHVATIGDGEVSAPPSEKKQELIDKYNGELDAKIKEIWKEYRKSDSERKMTKKIFERGWGGAGIWYNAIARINGGFIGAVNSVPSVGAEGMPRVMIEMRDRKSAQDTVTRGTDVYCGTLSQDISASGFNDDRLKVAQTLCGMIKYWNEDDANQASNERVPDGNAFTDAMNLIFGLNGLFEMRKDNAATHPLAQLSGLGKGLVDSAVLNIGGSTVFAFGGGMAGALGIQTGATASAMAISALNSIAFLGLTAGFILYYILPFMPFIYFFFALGSWMKTIFEAMVGVPLWALAHLRLDGEGLPGDSAANGYFLIFEIFVRPILTVFGLIAAIVIFTAQVRSLNFIWDLVTDNLSGFQGQPTDDYKGQLFDRGIIDKFFFTLIYTIICYMLANASFKLIDKIPDNILRWMGGSVSSFSDTEQDNIEKINQYAAFSGISVGKDAISGLQEGAKGLGQGVGGLLSAFQTSGKAVPGKAP